MISGLLMDRPLDILLPRQPLQFTLQTVVRQRHNSLLVLRAVIDAVQQEHGGIKDRRPLPRMEIGRASCRERV